MIIDDTFNDVLDILKIYGDEIMMAFYGNECKAYLEADGDFRDDLMFYDCYDGGKFFSLLFRFKSFNQRVLDRVPIKPLDSLQYGFIYHCKIETTGVERNYATDQVH